MAGLSRFDRAVLGVLSGLALATAGLIWRGDQVGVTVVATTPAAGAGEISRGTVIRATFGETMSPDQAEPFVVDPPVAGRVTWQGRAVTLHPDAPLAPGTSYRVTLHAGLESTAGRVLQDPITWSFRTGETRVLFMAQDADGQNQLHTVAPAGGPPSTLTFEPPRGVWEHSPSPDGSTIAYTRMRAEGGSDIVAISRGGREPKVLLACPDAECTGMTWAPDGQTLVYERRTLPPAAGPPAPPRLWWLDVARASAPAFSPESVATSGAGAPGPDAVTVPVFADNQRLGFGARLSPDGRRLAYTSPTNGTVEIHDLETGAELSIDSQTGEPAAWAPDGRSLLATGVRARGEQFVVHILKANFEPRGEAGESELMNLSGIDAEVEDSAPAWSPDGAWIAFARREQEGPGNSVGKQIWLMRADGSDARRLTRDATAHFGPPVWSPDGRSLLVQRLSMTDPGAAPTIGVLDVATGALREIAAPASQPAWLP